MEKNHNTQITQWQGFEKFYESNDLVYSNYPSNERQIYPKIKQTIGIPNKRLNKKIKNSKSQRKQKTMTIKVDDTFDNINIVNQSVSVSKYPLGKVKTQAIDDKIYHLNIPKYCRIPIYGNDKQMFLNLNGKNIYKGFNARNSYQLLRFLSEYGSRTKYITLKFQQFCFNSNFESGNLNQVYRGVTPNQFNLYMRVDTNTNGHRQWFYFCIKNTYKAKVRLNIYQFKKKYSLFQKGMKPYIKTKKHDWTPGGTNITYQQIKTEHLDTKFSQKYYYLSFDYEFLQQNDEVYFAAGIPYTYSYLHEILNQYLHLSLKFSDKIYFQKSILTKSLSGLEVPFIRISPAKNQLRLHNKIRKHIIVNARSHPGEVSSSWVVDGLIKSLVTNQEICQWINQDNIFFTIVPMLNPDGVFAGNYRTGILGEDFNRNFLSCNQYQFPEIYKIRKLVSQCKNNGKIEMFLDIHGHSALQNSFIYGPRLLLDSETKLAHLPYLLSKNSEYFSLNACKFRDNQLKLQTARLYFQIKENILSLTCQNSLGLWSSKNTQTNLEAKRQMGKEDWRNFGQHLATSICLLLSNQSNQTIKALEQIENQAFIRQNKREIFWKSYYNPKIITPIKVQMPKNQQLNNSRRKSFRIKTQQSSFLNNQPKYKNQFNSTSLSRLKSKNNDIVDNKNDNLSSEEDLSNYSDDSDNDSDRLPSKLKKQLFFKVRLIRKRQMEQQQINRQKYQSNTHMNCFRQYFFKANQNPIRKNQKPLNRYLGRQFIKTFQNKVQLRSIRHKTIGKQLKINSKLFQLRNIQIKMLNGSLQNSDGSQRLRTRTKQLARIKQIINN